MGECVKCGCALVIWGHDARAAGHQWAEGSEGSCCCGPEPVCVACEIERVREGGFLLVERSPLSRGVASAVHLVH